jgi:predicted TIM-barrel fold metal-dependent hydrolase
MSSHRSSREIHESLGHKVIDSDGHWREFEPIALDFLAQEAGAKVADRWAQQARLFGEGTYSKATWNEKLDKRLGQPSWWGMPVKRTVDVATSFLPKLLHERMPEMGLDFCVLYPSGSQLLAPYLSDEELRVAGSRAFNAYVADAWKDYSDRCAPVGVIPMHTPAEAVAELEHCKELGLKAVVLASLIRRDIPALQGKGISRRYTVYSDVLGIDSPYDYDPVWAKCLELGYSPSFHTASSLIGLRNSPSSFVYNHIGHFAEANHAVAKAIFLGGVTRRFPGLRFVFLEGGAAWGCALFADLLGHWDKRNGKVIGDLDPAKYDVAQLADYLNRYGGAKYVSRLEDFKKSLFAAQTQRPQELDDFRAAKIGSKQDIHDLYVKKFYFGCEADDPTTNYAFQAAVNPFNAKLGAMLSSDISHWDVPDMTEVLEEAWEHVEDRGMSEEDFYAFTFGNAVDAWTATNPDFFRGTAVEKEAYEHQERRKSAKI